MLVYQSSNVNRYKLFSNRIRNTTIAVQDHLIHGVTCLNRPSICTVPRDSECDSLLTPDTIQEGIAMVLDETCNMTSKNICFRRIKAYDVDIFDSETMSI